MPCRSQLGPTWFIAMFKACAYILIFCPDDQSIGVSGLLKSPDIIVLLPVNFAFTLQVCPTLCDPMDSSLPRSSVYGILQARILEWVAVPSSKVPLVVSICLI